MDFQWYRKKRDQEKGKTEVTETQEEYTEVVLTCMDLKKKVLGGKSVLQTMNNKKYKENTKNRDKMAQLC